MGMYRKEWDCCGSVTETDAWEPEKCPFCTSDNATADLLRACRGLIAVINDGISDPEDIDIYQQAKDIIAKATGAA